MIEKTNIKIENKLTKQIDYYFDLDVGFWYIDEYDDRGKEIYHGNSGGYWSKTEYNDEGNIIYHENSNGYIRDDRKIKHTDTQ